MRVGLVISSVIHAGLVVWALFTIERTPPLKDISPPDPVVTEIISESDLAKIRKGSRTAKLDTAAPNESPSEDKPVKEVPKPKPKPVAATPPPEAAPPPPPTEPVKPPEPPSEPKVEPKAEPPPPDKAALDQKLAELALQQAEEDKRRLEAQIKKAEADAKAAKAAKDRADRVAKEKSDKAAKDRADRIAKEKADRIAKEREKQKPLDTDRLSALLDKSPDQKQAPAAAPPGPPTKDKGPVKGAKDGRDAANAANERSALLAMIVGRIKDRGCWNIQAGGELASSQVPKVQFELNPDGSVRGQPRVLNAQGSQQFQLAADAATAAVLKCQPFQLPPDKYSMWRLVTLDFDPREMFQ